MIKPVSKEDGIYYVFLILFVICAAYCCLPRYIFTLPAKGIDPSWVISINMAIENGFEFGKDYLFTYGPLGFLKTGMSAGIPAGIMIFFHFLLAINLIYIAALTFSWLPNFVTRSICLIIIILTGPTITEMNADLFLFFSLLFHLLYYLEKRNIISLFLASIIPVVLFYCKVNTGIIAMVMLYVVTGYIAFTYVKERRLVLPAIVLHLLLLIIGAWYFNVAVFSYVAGALHLIDAYNDAMYVAPDPFITFIYGGIIFLAYITLAAVALFYFRKELGKIIGLGILSLVVYVLWKQGNVRADGHQVDFFKYIILLFGLLYLIGKDYITFRKTFIVFFVPVFLLTFLGREILSGRGGKKSKNNLFSYAKLSPYHFNYDIIFGGSDVYEKKVEGTFNAYNGKGKLSKRILDEIGNSSVDIIWFQVHHIFFNKLNYNPRPVVQSYSAYDEYLDGVNAAKYRSDDGPEYILFQNGTIDGRPNFWDESQTKMAMLENYEVINCDDNRFNLLKRLDKQRQLIKGEEKTFTIGWNELQQTQINNGKIQILKAEIKYSLLGKLRRLLWQPYEIRVKLNFEDGRRTEHRAIPPILEGGVIYNKQVFDTEASCAFFASLGRENTNTTGFLFDHRGATMWVRDSIEVTITDYSFEGDVSASIDLYPKIDPISIEGEWTVDGLFTKQGVYPTTFDAPMSIKDKKIFSQLQTWGSWSGNDANTSKITSTPFTAPQQLNLFTAGYFSKKGNKMYLKRIDNAETFDLNIATDPREQWKRAKWILPKQWVGQQVQIVAIDETTEAGGWIGISEPLKKE